MESKKNQREWWHASQELLYSWELPWGKPGKKLSFFTPFLSSLLNLIRKHSWDKKGVHGQQQDGITAEISCSKWQHTAEHVQDEQSLPQQQQEMLNHALNAVEQNWPWGTQVREGLGWRGRRTKSHRIKGRGKKWPGGQLQLSIF